MDNKKIGKLISDLRKKQDLTQEELGDKVGVGFRAVSKWERGITLPDITIINELSKILGISSDELLSGELKEKPEDNVKKKPSPRIIVTISIITSLILIFTSIFIYQDNKTYTYKLASVEPEEYYIDGIININKEYLTITINKMQFKDNNFSNTIIKNYEYEIRINDNFIFGYGFTGSIEHLEGPMSIEEFTKTLTFNIDAKTKLKKEEIIKNNLTLKIKFLTIENEEIIKELKIFLDSNKE